MSERRRPRKLVSIQALIENVNHRNIHSTCSSEVRDGWNALVEHVMHDANVYAGFGYLRADQLGTNITPGIVTDSDGHNTFPDESRRFYYLHKSIR